MANDSTTVLNPGVGGDVMDDTIVTDPTTASTGTVSSYKRERVVIGGNSSRAAVVDTPQGQDGAYALPVLNAAENNRLDLLLIEARRHTVLLRLIVLALSPGTEPSDDDLDNYSGVGGV